MYRPQLRIGAQEVMPVGAVGFGRVIDDLNHDERLFVGDRPAPERSEDLIMVEPNPAGIAQISGDAADLLAMPVALDHDPAQARGPHALDVIDRDPLRLFNKVLRHFCAMPVCAMPAVGQRRALLSRRYPPPGAIHRPVPYIRGPSLTTAPCPVIRGNYNR